MKFSYHWLQTYFDENLPEPKNLAEILTFHAFEVEGIEAHGEDFVFDIDVLPNRRHDCLSHRGVAQEISVLTGIPLARDLFSGEVPAWSAPKELKVAIEDADGAPRYMAALVKGVSVCESPDWLKKRFRAVGQKPLNNIVDATNFVMFELGQPLHAFDADVFAHENGAAHIAVRSAEDGEVITALGGEEYELKKGDMVIADGVSGVALGIAGVKGGVAAEISEKTKNIIIESANFNPARVRATATRLGLRTDASLRFESGLAPEQAGYALKEVIMLIEKLTGAALLGVHDIGRWQAKNTVIPLSSGEVNKLLGTDINDGILLDILGALKFPYEKNKDGVVVTPPFERLDVETKEDLIEEVGRVYGYEKIAAAPLPKVGQSPLEGRAPGLQAAVNKNFYYTEKIRDILVGLGWSEVYTHAIGSEGEVALQNPLASDKAFLRATLITPQFEEARAQNEKNKELFGGGAVKMFEIGKVFNEAGEHWALALAGDAAELFAMLEMETAEPESAATGIVSYNLEDIIAKLPEPVSYAPYQKPEIEPRYRPISHYPFVLRDIAVFAPERTSANAVLEIIKKESEKLLVHSRLFDEFKKDGKISYAFRLVFQSYEKTLDDSEVNEIMARVAGTLNAHEGFMVR